MAEYSRTWPALIRGLFAPLIVLAALVPPRPAQAQGDGPPVLPAVLADLSQREGRPVTTADLDDWRWSQRTFEDTSLGCLQPGEEYQARPTSGYRIILSYRGATYDYRVTRDGTRVILCPTGGVTPSPTPSVVRPTPLPTVAPTAAPPSRDVCPNAPPTRLAVGRGARIADSGAPVQLRAAPGTEGTILGLLAPGQTVTIVGGPECSDGLVWWQVDYQRLVGWVFEAQNEVYWLEPAGAALDGTPAPPPGLTPTPRRSAELDLPPDRVPITLGSARRLIPFVEMPIEQVASAIAWSADGRTLAVAAQQSIWLFAVEDFGAPPRLLRVANSPVHDVAFSPVAGSGQMATAHDDGSVRLWDVATGGQVAVFTEHHAPVQALAFSPDGTLLASGGGNAPEEPAAIILWDLALPGPIGRLEGHSGRVRALAFSPDGTLLASGADDHTVRLWDLVSMTPVAVLEGHSGPVLDVAFSPDAALIASAAEDGTTWLWDSAASGGLPLNQGAAPVRTLAFAPSGDLLVTGQEAGDGAALGLWDVRAQAQIGAVRISDAKNGAVTDVLFADGGAVLAILTAGPSGSGLQLWGVTGAPQ